MAPEAEAFSGYENPTNRYGSRTYVTVQGLGIQRKAGSGPGEKEVGDFRIVSTNSLNLPNVGQEYGVASEEPAHEEMA